jgi:hypothetical protein
MVSVPFVEVFARPARGFDTLDEKLEVVEAVDQIETFGIDHHRRRGRIVVEKSEYSFPWAGSGNRRRSFFPCRRRASRTRDENSRTGLQMDQQIGRSDDPGKNAHLDKIFSPDDRTIIIGWSIWNDNKP